MTPEELRAQLAQLIREEYDTHPVDRYPTEFRLAEVLVEKLQTAGIAAIKLIQPGPSGKWSISAPQDLYVTEDGQVCQHLPKSSGMTFMERSPGLVIKVAGAMVAAALQGREMLAAN